MNDGYIYFFLVIVISVLVFVIAKLASFWRRFAEDTRYICHEMDRADNYEEYRRWRGELRCHYLCLIPFVTGKNVMRLYNRIYHRADRKHDERKDSIAPLLMPSILGICICLVCVCGMTWAWYTASVETPTQKMTAAYYEVTVELVKEANGMEIPSDNGIYTLTAGTPYTVTLKASGTVKECGGYCLIQNTADGTKTYTQTFKPGESITVQFTPTANGSYTFTGVWGSLPAGTENFLGDTDPFAEPVTNGLAPDNTTVPATNEPSTSEIDDKTPDPDSASNEPTEDQTPVSNAYTVQPGDTLSAIADKCNTTVAKLAVYNGIADANSIYVGQIIKIPPKDWEMPVDNSSSSEQTETDLPSEPTEPTENTPDNSKASQPNQQDMPNEQETAENSAVSNPMSSGESETDSAKDSSATE